MCVQAHSEQFIVSQKKHAYDGCLGTMPDDTPKGKRYVALVKKLHKRVGKGVKKGIYFKKKMEESIFFFFLITIDV